MVSPSPGARERARLRSIFLSDVHLGSPRAQAELLLDFLAHHEAEYLFLVGDIADDAEASPVAGWPPTHRAVLTTLRRLAEEGTRVHYTTGNHDPRFAELWGAAESLAVAHEHEHVTADGRRLWVVHGDGFDAIITGRRWLSACGDTLARLLENGCLTLERMLRTRRPRLGTTLREGVKRLLGYTGRFERSAVTAARARSVDGIVCGHVHSAASRMVDGVYYGNGGDWVGSATALVEHDDGRMELVCWEGSA